MLRLVTLLATVGIAAGFTALYRRRLHRPAPRKDRSRQRRVTVLVRPSAARAHWKEARAAISARHHVASAESDASLMGILVHGCHLEADSWEDIVWGVPPHQLGRLPHAALLAWEEREHIKRVVCGTGASVAKDGRLEGQYTVDLLFDRMSRLREFEAFADVPQAQLEALLRRVVVAETTTQNTIEEVQCGLKLLAEVHCHKAVLVSSPTHLPRCLACACRVEAEQPDLFHGSVWASPSDTSYQNFSAGDVVVVEPPHRGDRDHDLDRLPFHEMVKRSYRVKADQRVEFLEAFDGLLKKFNV